MRDVEAVDSSNLEDEGMSEGEETVNYNEEEDAESAHMVSTRL